jgi:hypothetical protein
MLILFIPGAPREGHLRAGVHSGADVREERSEFFVRHDTYWAT